MTAYDAGTAFLQIIPSFRGVDGLITAEVRKWNEQVKRGLADALPAGFRDGARAAAPEGTKAGQEFGGAFAQSVRKQIEAGLKALPKVELRADSSDTDRKIADIRARLEALRDKRIGVDIDEAAALAEIRALTAELDRLGSKDPNIGVRVDAARASAELAEVNAQVDRLDGRTARVKIGTDNQIGVGLLPAGLGLAASAAVPVGAAALGLGAGITTALGAGAAGLGVLGLGLSNVQKAVQDVAAAHNAAGTAAVKSGESQIRAALAVAAAERQVKAAQEGLANARANAADAAITSAERVQAALAAEAAAERSLSSAQQQQKAAQQALTAARKAAQQQIEDLTQAVADGQLSQRQADLDVTKARLNLQTVESNPLSSQVDRQQAQLDYDTAVQQQKDLATQQQRTIDAQKAAVKAGVDGAASVVQAQRGVVAANQAVADAYAGIKTAAQGVADAQRAQAAQARQSAYAIEQAQNSLVSAQAAVQAASVRTASASSKTQAQLAALSPAMLQFATFIQSRVVPAFNQLRAAAQAGLLPGLQEGLTTLLPVLPAVTRFVGSLAKTMGDLFAEGAKALTSPFWEQFFSFVGQVAGPVLTTLARSIGNVITGFAGLLQAFWPVSKAIGDGILSLTQRFADFGEHLGTNGGFQSFLTYVQTEGPVVAAVFGNLVTLIANLVQALAPFGALVLSVTKNVTGFLAGISPGALLAITEAAVAMFVAFKIGLIALKVNALESATAMGVLDAVLAANPIGLIALAVGGLAAGLVFLAHGAKDDAVPAVDLLAEAEGRLTDAVDHLNSELKKSIDNFTILRDGALSQERANENLEAAFDAVSASIHKNGATLDINTAAGRANRGALVDVITAMNDKVTADFKANESTMGYQKALRIASSQISENRNRLIALARQSGLSESAAKKLVDQILLTPKQVVTRFKTPDLKLAQTAVDNLNKSLVDLRDGKWLVKVLLDPQMRTGQGDLTLGGILPAPAKAEGGAITGPGTWTSDTAGLYRLSNGEHVWPAREVAAIGGQQAMYQLRHVLTGYASGGSVGSPSLNTILPGMRPPAMANLDGIGGAGLTALTYAPTFNNPVPEPAGHSAMRGQQLLLHELSNR